MSWRYLIGRYSRLLGLLAGLVVCFCLSCKDNSAAPAEGRASSLPTEAMTLGGETFTVELAFTRYTRGLGLMFRRELEADRGMLFIFAGARPRQFYMRNCLIDLDAVFIRPDGGIDTIYTMLKPVDGEALRFYSSDSPVQYVLELPAGTAQRLGLQPGQHIKLPERVRAIFPEAD